MKQASFATAVIVLCSVALISCHSPKGRRGGIPLADRVRGPGDGSFYCCLSITQVQSAAAQEEVVVPEVEVLSQHEWEQRLADSGYRENGAVIAEFHVEEFFESESHRFSSLRSLSFSIPEGTLSMRSLYLALYVVSLFFLISVVLLVNSSVDGSAYSYFWNSGNVEIVNNTREDFSCVFAYADSQDLSGRGDVWKIIPTALEPDNQESSSFAPFRIGSLSTIVVRTFHRSSSGELLIWRKNERVRSIVNSTGKNLVINPIRSLETTSAPLEKALAAEFDYSHEVLRPSAMRAWTIKAFIAALLTFSSALFLQIQLLWKRRRSIGR